MAEMSSEKVKMIDPSLVFRPEEVIRKTDHQFRSFQEEPSHPKMQQVKQTYLNMHTHQSVEYVKSKLSEWGNCNKFEATIFEALEKLNDLIDESDPDVNIPNIVHAFQTAECIRKAYPNDDWFHLTGLIHDLGKVMAFYGEPQWSIVGDTFAVGCEFPDSIVYRHSTFHNNPDLNNPKFKFHSLYPWHSCGDYMHLCDNYDLKMLPWVREFNKFDLYTKKEESPNTEELKPYYQSLIDKYCPGKLKW
nr:inositol oxygenase-like isoform X3 [Cherax quadricarinatus]